MYKVFSTRTTRFASGMEAFRSSLPAQATVARSRRREGESTRKRPVGGALRATSREAPDEACVVRGRSFAQLCARQSSGDVPTKLRDSDDKEHIEGEEQPFWTNSVELSQ